MPPGAIAGSARGLIEVWMRPCWELPIQVRRNDPVGGLAVDDREVGEEPGTPVRDDPRILAGATRRQAARGS